MEDEIELVNEITKLTGIIFRKALLENDFEKVYSKVFSMMGKIFAEEAHVLEIFGDIGG